MSEITKKSLERILQQLKCHFTWNLMEGENSLDEFEDRVCNKTEFQNNEFKATACNILAYIKHCRGQNEAALECLRQAEEFIQRDHAEQAEIRSLVTWGNYAWIYYHLDQLQDAQFYVNKIRQVCEKFSSPYRIECPELNNEEGWVRLKCGGNQNARAKVCFEKALEKEPNSPEFTCGLAIATFRLDDNPPPENPTPFLQQAIQLNPDNQYLKVLMALKLQKTGKEGEGERWVEEALEKVPCATDVLRGASRFYRNKDDLDKVIELLERALESLPNNVHLHFHIGSCYRVKITPIMRGNRQREGLEDLVRKAVGHLKIAEESNGNFPLACSYLACLYAQAGQYEEAEHYFQKELSKELAPVARQLIHLRYGNFQLFQMKREDRAIHHFMEGVKINQESKEREKMKSKLIRIATTRLKYGADAEALRILSFLKEQNGEMQPADENPEGDLDSGGLTLTSLVHEGGVRRWCP